jgi:hypothetical protein
MANHDLSTDRVEQWAEQERAEKIPRRERSKNAWASRQTVPSMNGCDCNGAPRPRSPKSAAPYFREGEQHVEGEPAHAAGRVERLGHGHEGHGVLVEQFHQSGEIRQ